MAVTWRARSIDDGARRITTRPVRTGGPVTADDEFLTVGDVAERLRVHPQTVRSVDRAWRICARSRLAEPSASGGRISRRCWSARGSGQRSASAPGDAEILRIEPSGRGPSRPRATSAGGRPASSRRVGEGRGTRGERSLHEAHTASPARQAARAKTTEAQLVAATNAVDGGHRWSARGRRRTQLHRLRSRLAYRSGAPYSQVAGRMRTRLVRDRLVSSVPPFLRSRRAGPAALRRAGVAGPGRACRRARRAGRRAATDQRTRPRGNNPERSRPRRS